MREMSSADAAIGSYPHIHKVIHISTIQSREKVSTVGKKKHKKSDDEAKLSKKQRRKLEEREAEIRAELERRAEKKAKKGKKKGGKKKAAAEPLGEMTIEAEAPIAPAEKSEHEKYLEHVGNLHAIVEDESAKPKDRKAARAELDKLRAEGQARIDEKDAARAAETDDEIKARVAAKRKARLREGQRAAETDGQIGRVRKNIAAAEAEAVDKAVEAVKAIGQVVDAVETESGRIFEAGSPEAVGSFAQPSEAPRSDFEVNGRGQYKVKHPETGKLVGYTRVTTYINCLEDTSALTAWKQRILLEGVAAADGGEASDTVTDRVRALVHNRDVKIAKARKADRKGKLEPGTLGPIVNAAWAEFKKALDALADEAFEIGGGREKATKGTDIHALCDLHDREGITAVGDLLTAGEITPADMADVEAYADAMRRLGAKVIEAERVVVNDELRVAGRLDRVVMVKLPGETRARRRVLDIKTGRVDYGQGKIAQQIETYSGAKGYDLDTHEREDLKLDRTKGILLHLPAGEGRATVHVVDLVLGRRGNKLAAEVRTWRNEGKRAIDLKTDVLAELAAETEGAS